MIITNGWMSKSCHHSLLQTPLKSSEIFFPFMVYLSSNRQWINLHQSRHQTIREGQWSKISFLSTVPSRPSSNGLVEQAVQTIKQTLKQIQGGSLQHKLSRFLFKYNISPHSMTGLATTTSVVNGQTAPITATFALSRCVPES